MKAPKQYAGIRLATALLVLLPLTSGHCETLWETFAPGGRVEQAIFSADASRVACRMANGRVMLLDLNDSSQNVEFSTAPYAITHVRLSGDGNRLNWGDTNGTLYIWSPGSGLISRTVEEAGLTGIAANVDGQTIAVSGSGVYGYVFQTANPDSPARRNLGLEQIMAVAGKPDGSRFLAVDHNGWLAEFSGESYSVKKATLDMETPTGLQHVGTGPVEWMIQDVAGSIIFLDAALDVVAETDSGSHEVTTIFYDPAGNRVLIGNASGMIRSLSLADYSLSEAPLAELDDAVVGLGSGPSGSLLAMTGSGDLYSTSAAGEWVPARALHGHVLRGEASLQTGVGTIVTDRETALYNLNDGSARKHNDVGPGILLDSAIFHGLFGRAPVYLLMDPETLTTRLEGSPLRESYLVEDGWMPVRVACAPWLPQLALMSTDGEVRVFEDGYGGLVEIMRLDAYAGEIVDDLAFSEDQTTVRRFTDSAMGPFPATDGPFQLSLSITGMLSLARAGAHPAFRAWPGLVPVLGGGMDSGYFGEIRAIAGHWAFHQEFGWSWYDADSSMSYFQFPNEGWLAGNPDLGGYLYSYDNSHWIYNLSADFSTDWIYDFAQDRWRVFGW